MELFTMKYEHQKHRMALELLGAERGSAEIRLGCIAHRKDDATGEMKPEALILGGSVPVKELTRWAARKGFLKWQRKEPATPAEKKPEPEKPTTKKATAKAKATAKKKEKKNARTHRVAKRSASKSVSRASRRR